MYNELFKEELKFRKNVVQERELSAIKKLWSAVRLNNGIKILLAMLNIRTPITEADAMRALVCKVSCFTNLLTFNVPLPNKKKKLS